MQFSFLRAIKKSCNKIILAGVALLASSCFHAFASEIATPLSNQDAKAYRQSRIIEAQGEADRFTKILDEYRKAPQVTRQRLYIDTMREVLSHSSKVLVDTKGGNNMMYLPLDQLNRSRSTGTIDQTTVDNAVERILREAAQARNSGTRIRN